MKRVLILEVTRDALDAMPTKALLGRLRHLRECEDSATLSDMSPEELNSAKGILFKDTPIWRRAYEQLKSVLGAREHVPRPAEPQAARKARLASGRSRARNSTR